LASVATLWFQCWRLACDIRQPSSCSTSFLADWPARAVACTNNISSLRRSRLTANLCFPSAYAAHDWVTMPSAHSGVQVQHLARQASPRPNYASTAANLWVKSHMTESIQRILATRALAGQTPAHPSELIRWLEATAHAWNADPTPFAWAGKRKARRERAYRRRHPLGGCGACPRKPIRRRLPFMDQWRNSGQVTH